MASVSATHLILFIASLVVAVGVTGVVVGEVGSLSGAIEDRGTGVAEEIETDVVIVSDEARADAIYDGTDVTLLVKNTGDRDLRSEADQIDLVIDGRYVPSDDLTVERVDTDVTDTWQPGGVVAVTAADQDLSGDTTFTVRISGNDDRIHVYV